MKISVIVISKNEEEMLGGCLESISKFASEIILVDSESQDKTVQIAKKAGVKVISVNAGTDYSTARNIGLKNAKGDWIFYIDADERVSAQLRKEIESVTSNPASPAGRQQPEISYKIPRKNIILGKWVKHGGFWPDQVHRLFHKSSLIKWTGKLHETPTVNGYVKILENPLHHYTARSINSALKKSSQWSQIEAQLLYDANSPRVKWWKVIKAFEVKFLDLLIIKMGLLDGVRGVILAYIQAHHQASVLVNLWQLQNKI